MKTEHRHLDKRGRLPLHWAGGFFVALPGAQLVVNRNEIALHIAQQRQQNTSERSKFAC